MVTFCFSFCTDNNECDRFPCGNGATCINTLGSYYCNCPAGFSGIDCRTGQCFGNA
ncbi:hypothetical protein DPMN_141479 [Dreissena polymorpha]|uniref:EGF-like domain-containing protein n=1 Tax=Dreissena polymorpha TaxID=45954 RepID=A0A9D4G9G6_DREPO|nr:hypothetical protein DPMN_141479 [Dreissena polymorpha]